MKDKGANALASREVPGTGSFQTPLLPVECQERLLEVLERDYGDVHIYGTVTPESFELHRGTRVRAGAHPVLRGSFTPGTGGTRIDYRVGKSKSSQPIFKIAAVVWALMALSWVVFFVLWIIDRDGIGIGLPRLLILLGIVAMMGLTIAAGRRSDERGAAELLEIVQEALPSTGQSPVGATLEQRAQVTGDAAPHSREDH